MQRAVVFLLALASCASPQATVVDAADAATDQRARPDAPRADLFVDLRGEGCAAPGEGCGSPARCCSGLCASGMCQAATCGAAGAICSEPADCCSWSCLQHACQPLAPTSTDENRNRLLETLAQLRKASDRCALWPTLSDVQQGVFLTHTDMLGERSCLENSAVTSGPLDGSGTCIVASNPCQCAPGSAMALDHVYRLWSVSGNDPTCSCSKEASGYKCCNGGKDWHRTFLSADDHLIARLRAVASGLPAWRASTDLIGPHAPFDQSGETERDRPRGQTHFWSTDAKAVPLTRPGVEGVLDPHAVELDNDYNLVHDSSPEGCYGLFGVGCVYGRVIFKQAWSDAGNKASTTFAGNGQPGPIAELAADATWSPRCASARIEGVVAVGGGPLRAGTVIAVRGTGFLTCPAGRGCGNLLRLRTRGATLVVGASLWVAETPTELRVQLPASLAPGEGYLYLTTGGRLSNAVFVTLVP